MDEKQKFKKMWNDTSWLEKILVVALVGYFIYLNQATALVPNINDQNATRVINGIPNEPNTILYQPQDYVPKSNVSNTQMWIGIIITVLLTFVLLSRKALLSRATIKEALEDISDQMVQVKHLKGANINASKNGLVIKTDVEQITLTPQFKARYRFVGNASEVFEYVIGVEVKDDDGTEYFKTYYNPTTRYWDGFMKSSKEMAEEDQCPKCGNEYNEKQILGADLVALKAGKELLGSR